MKPDEKYIQVENLFHTEPIDKDLECVVILLRRVLVRHYTQELVLLYEENGKFLSRIP